MQRKGVYDTIYETVISQVTYYYVNSKYPTKYT